MTRKGAQQALSIGLRCDLRKIMKGPCYVSSGGKRPHAYPRLAPRRMAARLGAREAIAWILALGRAAAERAKTQPGVLNGKPVPRHLVFARVHENIDKPGRILT